MSSFPSIRVTLNENGHAPDPRLKDIQVPVHPLDGIRRILELADQIQDAEEHDELISCSCVI